MRPLHLFLESNMNRNQVPGFTQRCALLGTAYIVGASFNKGKLDWLAEQPEGTVFALAAEPENPWDRNAVLLNTVPDGERVGYVPKAHNLLPSRLCLAGQQLCATLVRKDSKAKVNERYTVALYLVLA